MARQEDALISLLHCAAMERSLLNEVRDDIAKVLIKPGEFHPNVLRNSYYFARIAIGIVCHHFIGGQTDTNNRTSQTSR